MTSAPLIRVSFEPAQANDALFPMPRQHGAPLVWRSAGIPTFDDLLNLDGYIMIDVVGGAVGQVEILHLDNACARSGPANDLGPLHRMIVDLSNRDEIERQILISNERDGDDLLFRIKGAPRPESCFALGGGLAAMATEDKLSGFRVSGFYG